MARNTDVVLDAIGGADQLSLAITARYVKLQQKDLDQATLLPFRVYPGDSTTYEYKKAGDFWMIDFGQYLPPLTKYAKAETTSSSDTFSQIEW